MTSGLVASGSVWDRSENSKNIHRSSLRKKWNCDLGINGTKLGFAMRFLTVEVIQSSTEKYDNWHSRRPEKNSQIVRCLPIDCNGLTDGPRIVRQSVCFPVLQSGHYGVDYGQFDIYKQFSP